MPFNDAGSIGRARGPYAPPVKAPTAPLAAPAPAAPAARGPAIGSDSDLRGFREKVEQLAVAKDPSLRAAVQAALQVLLNRPNPELDTAPPSGRSPETFGHDVVDLGKGGVLTAYNEAAGLMVWADSGRVISPTQWAAMDQTARQMALQGVPSAKRAEIARNMEVAMPPKSFTVAPTSVPPREATTTMQVARAQGLESRVRQAIGTTFPLTRALPTPPPAPPPPPVTAAPARAVIPPSPTVAARVPAPAPTAKLPASTPLPSPPKAAPPPAPEPQPSRILAFAQSSTSAVQRPTPTTPNSSRPETFKPLQLTEVRKFEDQLKGAKSDQERAILQAKLTVEALLQTHPDVGVRTPVGDKINTIKAYITRLEKTKENDRFAAIAESITKLTYEIAGELQPKKFNDEAARDFFTFAQKQLDLPGNVPKIQNFALAMAALTRLYRTT